MVTVIVPSCKIVTVIVMAALAIGVFTSFRREIRLNREPRYGGALGVNGTRHGVATVKHYGGSGVDFP